MHSYNKQKFKLIAIDCDGTLLDSQKSIPAGTREAISEAQARGIKIAITTGRNLVFLNKIISTLNLSGYIIGCGGAFIFDLGTEAILFKKTLPASNLRELIVLCHELKINLFMEDIHCTYYEFISEDLKENLRKENAKSNPFWKKVPDLMEIVDNKPLLKAMIVGNQAILDEMYRMIKDKKIFDNLVHSGQISIDILPSGVNKGTTLRSLASKLEIPRERIATIGDWWNDLDMFRESGLSIAMGNAPDEIKSAADLVAPSNDQNGASWALQKLFTME